MWPPGTTAPFTEGDTIVAGDYMKFMRMLLAVAAIAVLSMAHSASADDYDRGLDAFKKKNYAEAIALWTPLAENGHAGAQYNLARMYDRGVGVAENDEKATMWYARAAELGFSPAVLQLGMNYIEGEGVAQDIDRGLGLLRQAAADGNAEAEYQLGMLYRDGDDIHKDYAEAMKWYLTAAAQGHSEAQYMIGFMYGSGYGVPQDFVMAYFYYTLAADKVDISIKARDHLAEYMTADEITKAMSLVTEQRTLASSGQSLAIANP